MDVIRNTPRNTKTLRQAAIGGAIVLLALTTFGLSRLKTAAPVVERGTVVVDTVKRGPMTREVRADGVLRPVEIRWLSTATDARIERLVIQPGTAVHANDVIVELSNDQQQQAARDAEWQLKAAEADYETMRAQLENERLDREASIAHLRADFTQARLRADADAELERQGLAAHITREISRTSAEELGRRVKIEEERLRVAQGGQASRLSAARAAVEQRRAMYELQKQRTDSLQLRAGIDGVVQQVNAQAGQRIAAGTAIASVARPERLKAEVKVAETQAKDISVGQRATIDTRNGVVAAHVIRVDPAVREGTVTVDLAIDGALPPGARPDLSIDATIELDRLRDAVYVTRPPSAPENTTGSLFKVDPSGTSAKKVSVVFGRASASTIEIRSGVAPGDPVIVSDTSAYDHSDEIRIH